MSGLLTVPTPGSTRAIVDYGPDAEEAARDDRRVVALVADGHFRDAIDLTARAYGARLHRFFARWGIGEPEDHVQEVLVRVYEAFKRGRLDPNQSLVPWLFKIAANLRTDIYRTSRRQGELLVLHRRHIAAGLHGTERERSTWGSLTRQEQRLWLRGAIETLSNEDQLLLSLRYDAGLGWAEVSRVLGVRSSTAKGRFTQLRRILAERWRR